MEERKRRGGGGADGQVKKCDREAVGGGARLDKRR